MFQRSLIGYWTTLSTPSEAVQYAVAECLPPLVRASTEKTSEYVQAVLDQLFNRRNMPLVVAQHMGLRALSMVKALLR